MEVIKMSEIIYPSGHRLSHTYYSIKTWSSARVHNEMNLRRKAWKAPEKQKTKHKTKLFQDLINITWRKKTFLRLKWQELARRWRRITLLLAIFRWRRILRLRQNEFGRKRKDLGEVLQNPDVCNRHSSNATLKDNSQLKAKPETDPRIQEDQSFTVKHDKTSSTEGHCGPEATTSEQPLFRRVRQRLAVAKARLVQQTWRARIALFFLDGLTPEVITYLMAIYFAFGMFLIFLALCPATM